MAHAVDQLRVKAKIPFAVDPVLHDLGACHAGRIVSSAEPCKVKRPDDLKILYLRVDRKVCRFFMFPFSRLGNLQLAITARARAAGEHRHQGSFHLPLMTAFQAPNALLVDKAAAFKGVAETPTDLLFGGRFQALLHWRYLFMKFCPWLHA